MLLLAKKESLFSFVSQASVLSSVELKSPEIFGENSGYWGSEYRPSLEQTEKKRQGQPKRVSDFSMVTKP